ncbi:hypothetical protein AVEN_87416-1 [Araneus ventricosus]|uniref:Uncharacterized protein n=1 Tax=Araneus ventricosus TaxID=182803 RepID=A0A4Y2JLE8_ARAVE|nr:hypothetical protein AVEN_87416-1 [Araneus ventricosus]
MRAHKTVTFEINKAQKQPESGKMSHHVKEGETEKLSKSNQRMYSVKKGHFHRRNVNQRPQRYLVPGQEYARQEKQLPDVSLMAIQASRSFS